LLFQSECGPSKAGPHFFSRFRAGRLGFVNLLVVINRLFYRRARRGNRRERNGFDTPA
jgi:hypothetical protein